MKLASPATKRLLSLVAALCLGGAAPTAVAQKAKVWHVARCHVGLDHEPPGLDTLHEALNKMGYIDGKKLRFDRRNQRDADTAAATVQSGARVHSIARI